MRNSLLQMSNRNQHFPLCLSVTFIIIRAVIAKRFPGGFVTGSSSALCEAGLTADGKSGHFIVCLDLELILVMFLNKNNNWMSGFLVPSKPWERRTLYPSFEKRHTRYTTNMRDPTFILVTHFSHKIDFVIFLNEQYKMSALKFEGHCTTHVIEGVRMM